MTEEVKESTFKRYSKRYVTSSTKTASGKRKSVDNGDRLAKLLRGKTVEELAAIAKENGIDTTRWSHLNGGRFRMQVGRALRFLVRGKITLIIDGKKVASL